MTAMFDPKLYALFVHIPKTGGQSVESGFLGFHGLSWDERAPLLLRPNDARSQGPTALAHLFAREYVALGHMDQPTYDGLFKFAFVRNPWARLVSEYHYRGDPNGRFDNFVERSFKLTDLHSDRKRHVVPQEDYLIDENGTLIVDFIGRLETIQNDFRIVADRLGLRVRELPHRNKSEPKQNSNESGSFLSKLVRKRKPDKKRRPYQDYYSPALRDRVGEYYRRDVERFGYTFEGHFPTDPISIASA